MCIRDRYEYDQNISDHRPVALKLDFGTSIVYGFIAIPMLYWSGIRSFYLFAVLAPVISIISAFNLFKSNLFSFGLSLQSPTILHYFSPIPKPVSIYKWQKREGC
mgnify:CR=1 FL=1